MSAHGSHHDEHVPTRPASADWSLMGRLWQFIRPHQRWIWAGFALLVVTSACRLAMPYLVKIAIDEHLSPGDLAGFPGLLALFAAVAAVEVVGKGFQTWVVERGGQDALLGLRKQLFAHLQRLSSSFYDRTPVGRLVGRVTTDIEALQEMFSSGLVTILGDFLFLIATVVILLSLDVALTGATLLVVPVLLVLTLWIRVRVRGTYATMVTRRGRLNAFLHEHVTGMPVVQAFVRERQASADFRGVNGEMRDAQLASVRWETALSALTEMLGSFTIALILWFGGRRVLGDEALGTGLTLGGLFAFVDYMQRFFGPLNDLSLKYTVMQNAMTASDRIFALLDERDVTSEPVQPPEPPQARGAISFRNVDFSYDGETPVLHDVSFEVAPGERVAVVGATGSGKTTILKLLTRLYDPQSGDIELDGQPLDQYALQDLRRRVGIVPQDVFLFGGHVLDNIRLGHPEISEEDALAAANRLALDAVVARFPRGFREPVRERGGNLSSGERQLIAFARVLAVAPPVLALDEATSNVDTQTEALLQRAVHELTVGRTALVIAHRLSTIRDVDRILVLDHGRLVEEGTHEELLARRGAYWKLVQLQFRETAAPAQS